ncbi:Non-specific lipid-transfer protein 4 [Striga hermonthica]|uniref:Non-specific lipid-transfer protein n=1 Tax=Striga hermonthica TaxID=68872 RepID=A0A9N7RH84_STRHE|nr:Non-specific lipid-transfer protein 4 [Striga hermonthica]
MAHVSINNFFSLAMTICLAMSIAMAPPRAQGAITCDFVLRSLSPCLGYLRRGGSVPPACCAGGRSLFNAVATTPDLQAGCRCVKILVPNVGANPVYVNSLPGICGIKIPYKYSPSLDCSKVVR